MNRQVWYYLIDDDIDDQEIFRMAIQRVHPSITCTCVNNAVDALHQLRETAILPNCIFLDINMPRMNGIACLKALKQITRLDDVPVYMYSTAADPRILNESRELGATDFIIKPTGLPELVKILSQLFHN